MDYGFLLGRIQPQGGWNLSLEMVHNVLEHDDLSFLVQKKKDDTLTHRFLQVSAAKNSPVVSFFLFRRFLYFFASFQGTQMFSKLTP
jgi:hypothetical protein